MGQTKEGTYVVEDKKVKITIGSETNILTIRDDGCLDGGSMVGVFCKDGKKATNSGRAKQQVVEVQRRGRQQIRRDHARRRHGD